MALAYHVVGDLTAGKPELLEFHDTETLNSAIQAIADSPEGSIPIWKKRSSSSSSTSSSLASSPTSLSPRANNANTEDNEMRQQRFVGMLSSLDIAAFLANTVNPHYHDSLEMDMKLNTPVSEVVVPDNSLLRLVDPATRLIDALDMMNRQAVKLLLVPKSLVWKGMCKRFSVVHNAKWIKNIRGDAFSNAPSSITSNNSSIYNIPTTVNAIVSVPDKFCCLSREDVLRFVIGYLGALAPIPLTSIAVLGAINSEYSFIESSTPAIEASQKLPQNPNNAVAVVERSPEGQHRIIGEISAFKLWKCDYLAAAWGLANLSAGQFVMGVEDSDSSSSSSPARESRVDSTTNGDGSNLVNGAASGIRPRKFSSRSIGFFSNPASSNFGANRSMYRGRSASLRCKATSSLAAVMAQMLSYRATHIWVTEGESDDVIVGVVGYADVLAAVTKPPMAFLPATRFAEWLGGEIQKVE